MSSDRTAQRISFKDGQDWFASWKTHVSHRGRPSHHTISPARTHQARLRMFDPHVRFAATAPEGDGTSPLPQALQLSRTLCRPLQRVDQMARKGGQLHSQPCSWTCNEGAATLHGARIPTACGFMACRSSAYPFPEIESKWQQHWLENRTFRTPRMSEIDTSKPKFYVLDMCALPPPNGSTSRSQKLSTTHMSQHASFLNCQCHAGSLTHQAAACMLVTQVRFTPHRQPPRHQAPCFANSGFYKERQRADS